MICGTYTRKLALAALSVSGVLTAHAATGARLQRKATAHNGLTSLC